MIPKVIHYCWFGGKRKPKLIKDCISSWKSLLPDYNIIEWNEKNTDLSLQFVIEAYRLKKWAFVSDYFRLKVLYEFGGIYLDTDMMVVKTFDPLLKDSCFFGAEDKNFISCGIIGAERKNNFIKKCLDVYNILSINANQNWDLITMPVIVTNLYRENYNFTLFFDKDLLNHEIIIYQIDFFYPLPNDMKKDKLNYNKYITPNTFAVHLWNASWVDYDEFYYLENKEYLRALILVIKRVNFTTKINKPYLKKILKEIYNSFLLRKNNY